MGDACPRCGHDPGATVLARWNISVDREIRSLNAHRGNYGAQRWAYKADREAWQQWFIVARRNQDIPEATGKRRVTITRLIGYQQREFDHDNLVGGCKVVVDAMVRAGLLVSDKPADVEVTYRQERRPRTTRSGGALVALEELVR